MQCLLSSQCGYHRLMKYGARLSLKHLHAGCEIFDLDGLNCGHRASDSIQGVTFYSFHLPEPSSVYCYSFQGLKQLRARNDPSAPWYEICPNLVASSLTNCHLLSSVSDLWSDSLRFVVRLQSAYAPISQRLASCEKIQLVPWALQSNKQHFVFFRSSILDRLDSMLSLHCELLTRPPLHSLVSFVPHS